MIGVAKQGFSFIEMLVAVALLGLVAAMAIPHLSPIDESRLDLAASEVANAIRFARSEALRTGEVYSAELYYDNERVIVSKANLATVPVSRESILYHPVTKQLYDFNLQTSSATAGVEITNTAQVFNYMDTSSSPILLFDTLGTPVWIDTASGSIQQLADGEVRLGYRGLERTVRVAPITGRVTIQ